MNRIRCGDIELAVVDRGTGPPVLLVHGFPLDHQMWRGQIDDLAANYRVIAPDLRGFGQSGLPPGDSAHEGKARAAAGATATMAQMADDLAALLDGLGVEGPVVLGALSMGGYVAWQFVRRHRRRLRGLVLCDTRAAADSPEAAQGRLETAANVLATGTAELAESMLGKLFADATRRRQPALVEATRQVMLAAPRAGVAAALRGMAQRPDVTADLPRIDVPTLLIVGRHDAISTVDEMRGVAAAIPAAELVVVPDAGHLPPLEQPQAVNTAIRRFLGALPRG